MALQPGLVPPLRIDQMGMPTAVSEPDIMVEVANDDDKDQPTYDERGNILEINHADGSISISLDGNPLSVSKEAKDTEDWFRNLVEDIGHSELGRIANDLLTGIENDLQSRKKWIDDRAQGLKLLGLSIELPNTMSGSADGAPVEGMSRVRHPLLLEAVLRFQANARSELLPTDGPVKVRNDSGRGNIQNDQLSNALERDMNHYLTVTAKEYYPDTDRMLLMLGFSGTSFKKIYFCPLRNRPVSETVDANDLIVNDAATDLSNARRITHRVLMKPSLVKRLQILGVYSKGNLAQALEPTTDAIRREKDNIQGISPNSVDPDDRNREIYECYCELDIVGFEHKIKGSESGLEIPYRVTIDISSRELLSIVRNYDQDTEDMPEARQNFVKYTFVPGLGFYDIGLLHILGNTTNAITAAWRELLDAGMFASFPGFLFADTGGRQQTNMFRVPPGGGAPVKTDGVPINQAIMPLPYKEPSPALMQLVQDMAQTGMRIGGTSEQQVGEGRADAPVGTTLAMIDQATKVMNSVHKRMHAAQAEEFHLLVGCFREHPESFWQRNKKPANDWDEQTFLQAIDDCELIPQADPNTASHGQRVMKIMGLKQLQAANPSMYDPIAIDTAALQAMGWNNPEQFLVPVASMGKPSPEEQAKQAELMIKKQDSDSKAAIAQAQVKKIDVESQQGGLVPPEQPEQNDPAAMITAQSRLIDSRTKAKELHVKFAETQMEYRQRELDRRSKEHLETMEMRKDHLSDMADLEKERLAAHVDLAKGVHVEK